MSGPAATPLYRAEAAFTALDGYAAAYIHTGIDPGYEAAPPGTDGSRVTALLTGLMHCADEYLRGFSFEQALAAGREQYRRARDRMLLARQPAAAAASLALGIYENALASQARPRPAGLSTIAFLTKAGEMTLAQATAAVTANLLTDLEQYATVHGIGFGEALSGSRSAYAAQLIDHHGPFEPGTGTRRTAVLAIPPGGQPLRPVPVSAGVVISGTDAEWLLVRTQARIRDTQRTGADPFPSDLEDRRLLTTALADLHDAASQDILTRLGPSITARALDLRNGPAAAAALGYQHGITGAYPYARPHEGEEPLLAAFGETEPTTAANTPHRQRLISACVNAYARAQRHPAARPARHAMRDFPRDLPGFLPSIDPAALIRQAARQQQPGPRRPLRGL
jgi:hypothetical protein